jgi:hypothetical protein
VSVKLEAVEAQASKAPATPPPGER